MGLKEEILIIAKRAQEASRDLARAGTDTKNKTLSLMAQGLLENSAAIINANKKDIAAARDRKKTGAFIDRLMLDEKRIKKMSDDLKSVAVLPDCVGEMIKVTNRPNGLIIGKMRVPLGVIGIIYESRPNVTSDCAGLCLKSGNCVILKGGKESLNSNIEIYKTLAAALKKSGLPEGCINLIASDQREAVDFMLELDGYIDLIIPRGGESLIQSVVEKSKIPVIKHYKGVCHTYVDEYADLNMAEEVAFNAKVQRPATCNAMECLLVHQAVAAKFLPKMLERFIKAGVEIRGCKKTLALYPEAKPATEEDFATEYLDLILSVKVVGDLREAIEHIAKYGTRHSEAIITDNNQIGMDFLKQVDAACVYLNASTRFTDGNEFGLGAEIGISTDKLHARGPMGLEELTTYKYIIMGNGQLRQ